MEKYEQLKKHFENLEPRTKEIILSLLKDFCFLEEEINKLKNYPRYKINPKNPEQQIKLPVHDLIKDYQAQKNDIATKILRTINGSEEGESALIQALKKF